MEEGAGPDGQGWGAFLRVEPRGQQEAWGLGWWSQDVLGLKGFGQESA